MRPIARAGAGLVIVLVVAACSGAPTAAPTAADQPTAAPPTVAATPTEAPTEAPTSAPATPTAAVEATCTDVTDSGQAAAVEAAAAGFEWAPDPITAGVGDVITWANVDDVPHRVATDDGSCKMDSNISGGESGSLQFTVAGEYPYYCTVHPNMTGTIIITE